MEAPPSNKGVSPDEQAESSASSEANPRSSDPREGASWLLPQLQSPEGSEQVLQQLEACVAQSSFRRRLMSAQETARWMMEKPSLIDKPEAAAALEPLVLDPLEEGTGRPPPGEPPYYADFDADINFESECVVIGRTDVMDAMADFIVQCVVMHPEALSLTPLQLQTALNKTIKEMQKGRAATLWEWSKSIYKGTAWSYGVMNAYTHPWVIKAVLVGIWQSVRMMTAALPLGL